MNLRMAIVAAAFVVGGTSFAGDWKEDHPRRAEVNSRLNNQNRRIDEGVENGSLTKRQAGQLHREDRAIRAEERAIASEHGGHITKGEQRMLNRQENRVSHQIHKEKHR